MSKTRRPPEILRKSHPHLETDERARFKRELLDALDEATYGDEEDLEAGGGEGGADASQREVDTRREPEAGEEDGS